jgi:hypothetical protein
MKFSLSCFIFLSWLFVITPLYAGSETLTTYYPSPAGYYNKLQTNYMKLGASTLNAIQAYYKCSYDPSSGLPPCPAGIIYFDTDANTLFVSDGTHWRSAVTSCVALKPCSASLNCGSDSCGMSCGTCLGGQTCSSSTAGTPGSCV